MLYIGLMAYLHSGTVLETFRDYVNEYNRRLTTLELVTANDAVVMTSHIAAAYQDEEERSTPSVDHLVQKIPGDGNCGVYALLHQLQAVRGLYRSPSALRQEVSDYLNAHGQQLIEDPQYLQFMMRSARFMGFSIASEVDSGQRPLSQEEKQQLISALAEYFKTDKKWVSYVFFLIVSRIYQIPIAILQERASTDHTGPHHRLTLVIIPKGQPKNNWALDRGLVIIYNAPADKSGDHYDSLKRDPINLSYLRQLPRPLPVEVS